jgi:hypothetical protein
MSVTRNAILFGTALLLSAAVKSQSVPVGYLQDKELRERQLDGKLDLSVSFTVRPLVAQNVQDSLRTGNLTALGGKPIKIFKAGRFAVLPFTFTQQFNSHHPYGWNDGPMIAAKGYQALVSAGLYAAIGPLEIQAQPEFVFAPNPSYERNALYGNSQGKFNKLFIGQSKVSLSFFSMSAGLSTQSLWWGPGIHSSLLMSNNAPGFLHGFFSSRRPIKTAIGSFEWQLVGGRLTANSSYGYENYDLNTQPISRSRYLNGYVISYQPKWVPGLFVGMTRALQQYPIDVNQSGNSLINKYFPVLTKAFQKQNARADDTMHTDQLASFFLRWVFLKAKTEFYVEYGFNDYGYSVRDYIMSPTHSAAYLVGVEKMIPLYGSKYLDLNVELTQMSQSPDYSVREAGNWYTHVEIREGYTNDNQILGAGAGLGTNVLTFTASWVNDAKRLGFMVERADRDPLYHLYKWVDVSIGVLPQWRYRNIILSGLFQFVNSSQYAWQKDVNRINVHSRLTFQYLF